MKNLLVGWYLFAFAGMLSAQSVSAILARMDQAAPSFRAMSADVQMLEFTAVLSDKNIEDGTLRMQRLKPGDVRAIINFPGSREIAFLGKKLTIYYPKLNEYQDVNLGKNSNVVNQYMLLGFGSSGQELAQSYAITVEGQEKVADRDTTKLLLIPKDEKVLERLTKVQMWIPNDAAYPVQQQFDEPSGNYRRTTYSHMQLNPVLKGDLELQLPPNAKRQSQ